MFNPRYGWLGMLSLPLAAISEVMPLIFLPFVYVMAVVMFEAQGLDLLLLYAAIFLVAQLISAVAGVWLGRESPTHLLITPIYRLIYESLRSSDRAAYSAFIGELGSALHQAGKRLTVTVHAKTSEPGDWSGARAQDWKALGAAADEVRVMAYDYSTESSAPGPIAPLPWVQGVLQLAISEIPRDKIILGVATYGYDWSSGQPAQDAQWADAQAIAQARAAPVMWDSPTQTPWFAYTDSQGRPHTVWFEDARSLKRNWIWRSATASAVS